MFDECGQILLEGTRSSALARATDLRDPVPRLGRWKVRDVVAHLGGVHRWATRIVSTRSMAGPSFTKGRLDGAALCDWFDEGLDLLVATLRAADPDSPCPNFSSGSAKRAGFWLRRQAHETTVHRWDIDRALGTPTDIPAEVAADGVAEYLEVFFGTDRRFSLAQPVVLTVPAISRSWTIRPNPSDDRVRVEVGKPGDAPVELGGEAQELLPVLWNRLHIGETNLKTRGTNAAVESLPWS